MPTEETLRLSVEVINKASAQLRAIGVDLEKTGRNPHVAQLRQEFTKLHYDAADLARDPRGGAPGAGGP
jgi:hypothetical protein